jgi:hypothetical protein
MKLRNDKIGKVLKKNLHCCSCKLECGAKNENLWPML